ncbi:MAG: stage V sporulation T C-terminal domain-containing protein [Bacillota bacterium]
MKATGIIRRIDDLGRVVIPKEIRRHLRIRESEPLEIFVQHQNEIVLKKYSPVQALEEIALPYLRSIHHELGCPLLLMDREQFILGIGSETKPYLHQPISKQLDALLDKRRPVLKEAKETLTLREGTEEDIRYYFVPIISDSNQIGGVLAFTEGPEWPEATANVLNIFVHFLKMQLEI